MTREPRGEGHGRFTADAFGGAPRGRGCGAACVGSAASRGAPAVALAVALYRLRLARSVAQPGHRARRAQSGRLAGAYAADLLYQLFGFAAWLPVLVGLSWGVRLALGRPLAWAWCPS